MAPELRGNVYRRPQGAVGRADLLELLQLRKFTWLPLCGEHVQPTGELPGYLFEPSQPDPAPLLPAQPDPDEDEGPEPAPTSYRPPLRMPTAWVATSQAMPAAESDASADVDAAAPSVYLPPRPVPAMARHKLLQAERDAQERAWLQLRAPLRQALDPTQGAQHRLPIDWRALTRRAAQQQVLWPLPRLRIQRWPGSLLLVLDRERPSMSPFVRDMDDLAARLRRSMGSRAVEVRVLGRQALDPPRPWFADRGKSGAARSAAWPPLQAWHVLVISDGAAADPDEQTRESMRAWLVRLRLAGADVRLLAPARGPTVAALPKGLPVYSWQGRLSGQVDETAVTHLLACLALVGTVSDTLLQALARLFVPAGSEQALVWYVWNHADIERLGRYCGLRSDRQAMHEARIPRLEVHLLEVAYALRAHHDAGKNDADEHLATLRACSLAPALAEALVAQAQAARRYFAAELPRQIEQAADEQQRLSLSAQAAACVSLAHPSVRSDLLVTFRRLQSLAHREALERGESVPVYGELGAVAKWRPSGGVGPVEAVERLFVQRGDELWLRDPAKALPPFSAGAAVAFPLARVDSDAGLVIRTANSSRWFSIDSLESPLATFDPSRGPIEVTMGRLRFRLDPVERPRWASSWNQTSSQGLTAELGLPWARAVNLMHPFTQYVPSEHKQQFSKLSLNFGFDELGPSVELKLEKGATQTFRHISPGTFLMGSPDGVGHEDEHPQHPVTISQAFWLADTPCTQSLWQAVMGQNPSRFKDGLEARERPVDSVSWDEVQTFLDRLNAQLPPNTEAFLPTEAQWEYAARAGSRTAYWWGDEADSSKANWNQEQKGTTPVKRYAPNPWGLYDVHGNVWEWCAGSLRTYRGEAELDPQDGYDESSRALRALRGGSWGFPPGSARAAYRNGAHRDGDWRHYGFRLVLRSVSPGGGAAAAGSRSEPAVSGRGAPVPPPPEGGRNEAVVADAGKKARPEVKGKP